MRKCSTLLLLLLSMAPSLEAKESDIALGLYNKKHQCQSEAWPLGWYDGLWLWQAETSQAHSILINPNCQQASTHKSLQLPLAKQLVVDEQSTVAHSKDGRYLAVSGLVWDAAAKLVDSLPLTTELKEKYGAQEKVQPQLYPDQYRILLIDLQKLKSGVSLEQAVFNIFDTSRYSRPTAIPVDKNLRFGLRSEFPEVTDFNYGKSAKFVVQISDDSLSLYFRVYTDVKPSNPWGDAGPLALWNTRYTDPINMGVDKSFVIDIATPRYPELRSSVVAGESYYSKSTLMDLDEKKAWQLFSLSPNRQLLLRYNIALESAEKHIFVSSVYTYSHTMSLHGQYDEYPLDDVVVCVNNEDYPNHRNEITFIPQILWDANSQQFTSIGEYQTQNFVVADIVQEDSARSCLDSKSLQTEPDHEKKVDRQVGKRFIMDHEYVARVPEFFKSPKFQWRNLTDFGMHTYFQETRRYTMSYYDANPPNRNYAYARVTWPSLSRIAVDETDESAIERLAAKRIYDAKGDPKIVLGWFKGLAQADSDKDHEVWPIPGVVAYSVLAEDEAEIITDNNQTNHNTDTNQ